MASISREQLQKINNQCFNDWELDLHYYLMYGEKKLQKRIELDDTHYLRFTLYFNYKNMINLNWNKTKIEGNFGVSEGLGKDKLLDNTQYTRKSVNKLIELTKILDDKTLLEYNETTGVSHNFMFVDSPSF